MYELRPLDRAPAGLERLAGLLRAVFPAATHLGPAYLDWLYNGNPAGPALGFDAWHAGSPVGHYVLVPVRARLFGAPARGAHSLNGAVHPAHQGRRLYARLGEQAHRAACEQGFEFLIGVPNANSTHVFVRTFGFQLVRALEARLGIGPPPRAEGRAEAEYERAWDAETLRWRLASPGGCYAARARDGRCELWAPTGRLGVQVLLGEVDAELARELPRRRRVGPWLWIGAEPGPRQAAGWNLPRPLRPAPLHFVFLDLSGGGRRLDPGRLRYRALDFDAY